LTPQRTGGGEADGRFSFIALLTENYKGDIAMTADDLTLTVNFKVRCGIGSHDATLTLTA